jgi:hypothetical protein
MRGPVAKLPRWIGAMISGARSPCFSRNTVEIRAAYTASTLLPVIHAADCGRNGAMKMYRIVTLLASALIAVLVIWSIGHEHVGNQEREAIEDAAQ